MKKQVKCHFCNGKGHMNKEEQISFMRLALVAVISPLSRGDQQSLLRNILKDGGKAE